MFGQHAQMHATCPQDRVAAVDFFSPQQIMTVEAAPDQNVTAHLRGVPPTCVDIPIEFPCASHTPNRPPMWYCVYEANHGNETLGPFSAVVMPHVVHAAAPPMAYAVVLHCPVPRYDELVRIAGADANDGLLTVTLTIAHGSRAPGVVGMRLPFEGLVGGDGITFAGLPIPPSPPPPQLPPTRPPQLPPPLMPPVSHNETEVYAFVDTMQTLLVRWPGQFRIKVWGAAGGSSHGSSGAWRGGSGAYVAADCTVPMDTTLYIVVGEGGLSGTDDSGSVRGYGSGGLAGCCGYSSGYGGSGGGLSGVFFGASPTHANALIVAGAGGGSGGNYGGNGGGGGYASGQNGANGYYADGANCYGRGATQSQGGTGGTGGRRGNGGAGGALTGGDGHRTTGTAAGGGGAGWFGGGAAAGYYCAGGGGSSYIDSTRCTLVRHTDGEVGSGMPSNNNVAPDHPSALHDSDYVSGVAVTGRKQEQAGHGLVVLKFVPPE